MLVVEMGNGLSQLSGTSSRSILSGSDAHINGVRSWGDVGNLIVHFRSALAEIGPLIRIVVIAALKGTLCAPDDAR